MIKTKTNSRAVAILLTLLMVFGTFFASVSTTLAADETTGTLNIHKLSSTAVADEKKEASKTYYTKGADLNYEYLAGAKYTVYKIGTFAETNVEGTITTVFTADEDLVMMAGKTFGSATKPGDIDLAASITAGLSGTETAATTAGGSLPITGLAADGVYLIVESTLPAGVSTGADFIITVPMYNETTEAWEYVVNAYPKNSESDGAIDKTITTGAAEGSNNTFYANIGDTITYSVEVTVPTDYTTTNTDSANNYTKFNIVDVSSQYLDIQKNTTSITISGTSGTTFASGTDYNVDYTSNKLTVTFTSTGLAKILAGETLTVTYDAQILAGAANSTEALTNRAWIEFTKGTGSGTIDPPPIDPPVTVEIYSYGVKKVNEAGSALAGAKFKLATKDGDTYYYLSYNSTTGTWDSAAEDIAQVFTTATNTTVAGIADEAILQFKNLDPATTYYLIETEAPQDYIKLLNPVIIKATTGTTDAVYNTYDASGAYQENKGYSIQIKNILKANGGNIGGGGLPQTGGNGIYLYLIIGAVLMGAAVVFYVRLGKKRKEIQ